MNPLSLLLISCSFFLLHNNRCFWYDLNSKSKETPIVTIPKTKSSAQRVDPESLNFELLETILLSAIENQRPKLSKTTLEPTEVLKKLSSDLLAKYSYNNISYAIRKNKLSSRKWKRVMDYSDFKGGYKAIAIATTPLYSYPKNAKVYHDKSNDEQPFYYMQRKNKVPVSEHTYESLIAYLLKNAIFSDSKKLLKSKALSELGFTFRLEDRGVDKMPYLSVAIIGGGYRLQRLNIAQ